MEACKSLTKIPDGDEMKDEISELTLLLLYLASWEEKVADMKITGSWKNHRFEILDKLTEQGFIYGSKTAKSINFTDEGIKRAKELAEKYLKDSNG
jgi:hypothetical protein